MLRISTFLLAFALGATAAQAGVIPDRVVQAATERVAAGQYPVLVIAMVDGDKSEVRGFGVLPDGKAADGDTVFEIGSITKTFTATLLADAVLRKQVSLDDPVAKLLPGFTIPSRGGKQITLADIASQRSGLPRMPANFAPGDPANPYADYDAAKLKAFLAAYQLPRDPGASYEYSNLGFGLLGYALATAAHSDYPTLLHDGILAPLGMTSSGVVIGDAMRAHLAPGHDVAGKVVDNWDFAAFTGAGAIRSTANDMLRYLKANMGIDKTPLAAAMTLAQTPRADMAKDIRIGLAWMTSTTPKGAIVWHNGLTGGYASGIGFTADRRHGVVILTNVAQAVDDLGQAALDPDAPLAPVHKAIALPQTALEAYTGRYKLAENFILNVSIIDGVLFAQATGQGAFPIYAWDKDEFFARIAGIAISFQRDAKGAVSGLILHQGGDRQAPRLPDTPVTALDAATLAAHAGKYQLAPNVLIDVTVRDGQMFAQLTGQAAYPVYASARDRFFFKVADAQIDFERDASGAIVALILHQNGHDMRAPRTKE